MKIVGVLPLLTVLLALASCRNDGASASPDASLAGVDAAVPDITARVDSSAGLDGAADGPATSADAARGDLAATLVFEVAPCPGKPPANRTVVCGYVSVPEARGGSSSRTVRLAVAIVKSRAAAPLADPVVYLAGGPGGAAIATAFSLVAGSDGPFVGFLADRDLVVIDQRGTGASRPSLACPETDVILDPTIGPGPMMMLADLSPAAKAALAACRARLVGQGIDLSQYHTAANADDIDDVRRTLGYERWNLLGISYGTRLALEIMRRHPQGIRSVTIDSVVPPDVDLLAEHPSTVQRSFKLLFSMCEAQATCNRTYPGLRKALVDALDRLARAPAPATLSDGTKISLTAGLAMNVLSQLLYDETVWPFLPEFVYQLRDANYTVFVGILEELSEDESSISLGMHLSVQCADEYPFTSRSKVLAAVGALDADLRPYLANITYFAMCEIWNVAPSPATANEAVTSALPTLVLSGDLDPVTPPAWGARAATSLSGASVFTFKGVGHGVVSNACGASIARAFVTEPGKKPAPPCLGALGDPVFLIRR